MNTMNKERLRNFRLPRVLPGLIAVGLLVFTVTAASAGEGVSTTRSSSAGGIDVTVSLENGDSVAAGESETLEFRVSLDTHFTDLFQFDIPELSELAIDGGSLDEVSFEWQGDSETSHHRGGTLTARVGDEGAEIRPGDEIQLRIFEIGTEERTFIWDL